MSGGAVLNFQGQLIGVHGQGETDSKMTEQQGLVVKTGTNQGVPVSFLDNSYSQHPLAPLREERSSIRVDAESVCQLRISLGYRC